MQSKLLVAYDFSPASDRALAWAADYQRALGGDALVLHVIPLVPPTGMALGPIPSMPSPDEMEKLRGELRAAVERHGLRARAEVATGTSVAEVVLTTARAEGSELIVLGTHGRGALSRLVLGSVAEAVVRHAECPVLTTHAARTTE
jgi:nucleotide-binding universal stress UspA family protein